MGSMSICLNAVLFTVKGVDVKDNKYIPIFNMWFSQLIRCGGLTSTDILYLYTDAVTLSSLQENIVYTLLQPTCPFKLQLLVYPQPATLMEGMMIRFNYNDYVQDIFMYCDIDILILKPLRHLMTAVVPNVIYVHAEGCLSDDNYGAAFSKEELQQFLPDALGFSSGKFFIYGTDTHKRLYQEVNDLYESSDKTIAPFYTFDQPYYNKALYQMLQQNVCKININYISYPFVLTNNFNITDESVLLDAMGIPGDGAFHHTKLLQLYVLLQHIMPQMAMPETPIN